MQSSMQRAPDYGSCLVQTCWVHLVVRVGSTSDCVSTTNKLLQNAFVNVRRPLPLKGPGAVVLVHAQVWLRRSDLPKSHQRGKPLKIVIERKQHSLFQCTTDTGYSLLLLLLLQLLPTPALLLLLLVDCTATITTTNTTLDPSLKCDIPGLRQEHVESFHSYLVTERQRRMNKRDQIKSRPLTDNTVIRPTHAGRMKWTLLIAEGRTRSWHQ